MPRDYNNAIAVHCTAHAFVFTDRMYMQRIDHHNRFNPRQFIYSKTKQKGSGFKWIEKSAFWPSKNNEMAGRIWNIRSGDVSRRCNKDTFDLFDSIARIVWRSLHFICYCSHKLHCKKIFSYFHISLTDTNTYPNRKRIVEIWTKKRLCTAIITSYKASCVFSLFSSDMMFSISCWWIFQQFSSTRSSSLLLSISLCLFRSPSFPFARLVSLVTKLSIAFVVKRSDQKDIKHIKHRILLFRWVLMSVHGKGICGNVGIEDNL